MLHRAPTCFSLSRCVKTEYFFCWAHQIHITSTAPSPASSMNLIKKRYRTLTLRPGTHLLHNVSFHRPRCADALNFHEAHQDHQHFGPGVDESWTGWGQWTSRKLPLWYISSDNDTLTKSHLICHETLRLIPSSCQTARWEHSGVVKTAPTETETFSRLKRKEIDTRLRTSRKNTQQNKWPLFIPT